MNQLSRMKLRARMQWFKLNLNVIKTLKKGSLEFLLNINTNGSPPVLFTFLSICHEINSE